MPGCYQKNNTYPFFFNLIADLYLQKEYGTQDAQTF